MLFKDILNVECQKAGRQTDSLFILMYATVYIQLVWNEASRRLPAQCKRGLEIYSSLNKVIMLSCPSSRLYSCPYQGAYQMERAANWLLPRKQSIPSARKIRRKKLYISSVIINGQTDVRSNASFLFAFHLLALASLALDLYKLRFVLSTSCRKSHHMQSVALKKEVHKYCGTADTARQQIPRHRSRLHQRQELKVVLFAKFASACLLHRTKRLNSLAFSSKPTLNTKKARLC